MTTAPGPDWQEEFSLEERRPPHFFRSSEDINDGGQSVPQAHALRRAFAGLKLDGILCLKNTPLLYFKEVPRIDLEEVWTLHRRFWNQGLAPVLVIIAPKEVHVYSGLATPPEAGEDVRGGDRLVTTLDRVRDAAELRQFVLSLESGEFFHAYAKSFDRAKRVDRQLLANLEATREEMARASSPDLEPDILDALLCRVVFTCYLFDRKIIGESYLKGLEIAAAENLRDLLRKPKEEAKTLLYSLFEQLGEDFNGDLFNGDLDAERRGITETHISILECFLRGADVRTGQGSFWPYDFSVIPIETISAIYEHFLKSADSVGKKASGAFYTPRFLAEIVIDMAIEGTGSLLDKRFLDPACGSGIFLVGLFNRLAEEWMRKNPDAPYDEQASGLMKILRENLYGVDQNPTACRIAAFSLYLALLDQLKPSDIQELQRKGKFLPPLVYDPNVKNAVRDGKSIIQADFFTEAAGVPSDAFHLVIGNPPWSSVSSPKVPAETWCEEQEPKLPMANRQLAQAFVWKGPRHLIDGGRVCFVLPHGVLFNHQDKAVKFQREWFRRHSVELILNLVDFQRFLFEAEGPAVVARFRKEPPANTMELIEYLAPKTDWSVTQAAIISVVPEDRMEIQLREVFASLRGKHTCFVWKERFWGTPRDSKFLDRLSLFRRLHDIVGQPKEREPKRWLVAQGFQPMGENDDPEEAKDLLLPSNRFLQATARNLELFLLESDCEELPSESITVRGRSNTNTTIFRAPHVLVTKSLRAGYASFDVAFRHAVQGVHGPEEDNELLIFLAAYLRSSIARYFLFHKSSSWGVSRSEVHLSELLTLPFPLPDETLNPDRGREIVSEVAARVSQASKRAREPLIDRRDIVESVQDEANRLIFEYFDVDDVERVLVEDTNSVIIPSTRPATASDRIPTLVTSSGSRREQYTTLLCKTLNDWAEDGPYRVQGRVETSPRSGMGSVILERFRDGDLLATREDGISGHLVPILEHLQTAFKRELGSVEMMRGLKVFDRNTLYLIKPLAQRFWTNTAALNDADDIAGTILMRHAEEQQ